MSWAQRRAMLLGSTAVFAPPGERGTGDAHEDPPADDPEADPEDPPADDPEADPEDPPADDLEADPEDPPADDPEADPEDPPVQSRAERRIAAQQDRLRAAEQRAIDAENRLAEATQTRQQPAETPEQEAQRIALLTPEEQVEYRVNKALARQTQTINNVAFQMQDTADKSAYQARARTDKRFAKYEDEVEKRLVTVRKTGANIAREALLYYVIGERVVKGAPAAGKQQRRAGSERVNRQQARPSNGRSDTSGERRRSGDTAAKRLEGVRI